MASLDKRFETFQSRMQQSGERGALAYLNSLANFRFTAVIYFAEGRGHAIHYFDRENPEVTEVDEFDQRATYCNSVVTHGQPFETPDSMDDARLLEHPARHSVRAYLGVPIMADDGSAQASLCYFDPYPQSINDRDRNLLMQAAEAFRTRMAGFQLAPPASRVTMVRAEKVGNSTLHVVERIKEGWESPRYTIERSTRHADGSTIRRVSYGRDGFASLEEALEFGREWCRNVGDS